MPSGICARGLAQVTLIVGGVIPAKDRSALEMMGVAAAFSATTKSDEIVSFLERLTPRAAGLGPPLRP